MNFYIDSGGVIIATDPEQVYQGSAMANTIRLIAPFPLGASVTVSYILPDGTQMQPQLMTANKTLSGVQTETGVNFSVWEQNIGVRFEQVNGAAKAVPDFTVLSQVGKVGVVFTITQANASGQPIKQTTARSSFLCERGAPLEMPSEAYDDYKSLLNQILGQLSVAVQNDIYLEQAIQDVEDSIEEIDQKYEQSVTELEDGKVNRAGDTMTGPLKVDDPSMAGNQYTDYTAQGIEIADEHNRDYTAYKKDSIYREINDGDGVDIYLPNQGGTLALEYQVQDVDERLSSAIDGIREDIRNEAHFRGYVATNAEIQALKADDNDYAYSAESGTVWIYQGNAWTNSGKPVPDQSTPASNSTPLMDGTPSAGIAEAYARGDHVHPTDTTLAKTIDGEVMYDGIEKKNLLILRLYNANNELITAFSVNLPESNGGGGEGGTIVTVDGIAQETWDADTKVGFDDIASKNKAGVLKVNAENSGMKVVNGELKLYPASPVALGFRTQTGVNYNETSPITMGNLNTAVIAAFTDDKRILMTDDEKEKACETIGAVKLPTQGSENGTLIVLMPNGTKRAVNIAFSNYPSINSVPTYNENKTIMVNDAIADTDAPNFGQVKKHVTNMVLGNEAGNYNSLDEMVEAITGGDYSDLYNFLDYLWQNRNN